MAVSPKKLAQFRALKDEERHIRSRLDFMMREIDATGLAECWECGRVLEQPQLAAHREEKHNVVGFDFDAAIREMDTD